MHTFKVTLVASIGALLIGSASVASDVGMSAEITSSRSAFKCGGDGIRDRDPREWYSLLGIAKVNGNRVAVYALQNGARPDDVTGPGRGSADIFDSAGHLIRRFAFRENLNSSPQVIEFVSLPVR
jgi:hypothetical protein